MDTGLSGSKTTRRIRLSACIVAILFSGWFESGRAIDSYIDPSRPSTQPPRIPEQSQNDSTQTLELLSKPAPPPKAPGKGEPNVITLKGVKFEGNTVIPEKELQSLAAGYLGRGLTAYDLEELRYKVTVLYVKNGYINSGAVIPEQTVDNGELRIRIVEGRLNDIRMTGQGWLQESYIKNRLLVDSKERPLKVDELQQRYLMLLNDPLIERLNGSLLPGLHPGEAILDLKVTRARPYGGYLGADNFSPPVIGGYTGRVGTWVRNLTTLGDLIDFNLSASEGGLSYNTGMDIPLTAQGTHFAFRYTNAETSLIQPPYQALKILNHIISYDGLLSHLVISKLNQKLNVGLNFAVRQNTTTIDGVPVSQAGASDGTTQVTVFRIWQDYLRQAERFDVALRSTFTVGLDALGATVVHNDSKNPDGRFFAWLGQATGRYRILSNGAYVSVSGAAQLANDRLLALEKIAIGGFNTIRGFRQNYLVEDNGFFTSLQFGYPLFGGEPGSEHSLFLTPFMDYGGAWNYGKSATYIHSAGVGLEWKYSTFSAAFYWAGRISNNYKLPEGTPNDIQDDGINFQVHWHTF